MIFLSLMSRMGLGAALVLASAAAHAAPWTCEFTSRTPSDGAQAAQPAVPLLDRQGRSLVRDEPGLDRLLQLHALVEGLQRSQADTLSRLRGIHNFWNVRLDVDTGASAALDSGAWSTPGQVLDRGYGSVAELALGQYFSLMAAGVPSWQLRLVWVELVAGTQARSRPHMVVSWCAPGQPLPWLLDAFDRDVHRADLRPELRPLVSFNAEGLWLDHCEEAEEAAQARQASACTGLMPDEFDWRDLVKRIDAEGWR